MNILQVNTQDHGGGAARTAWKLHDAYRKLGHGTSLVVGLKKSNDSHVYESPDAQRPPHYADFLWKVHGRLQPFEGKVGGVHLMRDLLRTRASGDSLLARLRGRENFTFPGSHGLLGLAQQKPEIVHCHNLHGGFFDLRFLPSLSRQVPTVLTLHDAWLLSGHCAHSFVCERWQTGCGHCPDLSIYPSLLRDGTAANWQLKYRVYAQSQLFIATPSKWLMNKVEQSMLHPVESRVIPNGVDLELFKPGSQQEARVKLGIPQEVTVLLFVGSSNPADSFKDFGTLKDAMLRLATVSESETQLLCVGEEREKEHFGPLTITYVPYVLDEQDLAYYYQAADICVHTAKAENFPYVVLEALACGRPVVASAVGGIPEQIRDGVTGHLVEAGDAEALADCIIRLLRNPAHRQQISESAAADAHTRFDLRMQVTRYLDWYSSIRMNICDA